MAQFAPSVLLSAALASLMLAACEPKTEPLKTPKTNDAPLEESAPVNAAAKSEPGAGHQGDQNVQVMLCDGKTTTSVPKGTAPTAIAGSLMTEWLRKNPDNNWEAEERQRHTLAPAADNTALVGMAQGQSYGEVTEQDIALWKAETERVALAGSEVFHSGDQLGSTIGVSCDMCHPHAANTHPETYPKYQVQLGRVALLRDMINWCIQHPVRGTPFAADDPKMRSLEAYILAQRSGKQLAYGKH
jgi:thiosulfate dehydrogenase